MNIYANIAIEAIKTATQLDDQKAALGVLTIVEKSSHRQLETEMRRLDKQFERAL